MGATLTPRITERSVDPEERLSSQLQEENERQEAEKEPLARLKVEREDENSAKKDEIVEPLVRLVRYDSSIPNALDSVLPRYIL